MQLPEDRRKEFVISIDTAHVRSAETNSVRNSTSSWPDAVAADGANQMAAISSPAAAGSMQFAIVLFTPLQDVRCRGFGDVTVISDSAEILKRLPRAHAETDDPHHRLVSHRHEDPAHAPDRRLHRTIPVRSIEALSTIGRDIRAVKWRLWQ
ncbi:hypothetical protein [Mesorhizobium sp. M0296]|uniref:hypothetical protein n=1 Tax=Mesorhizobium sp. M0296 TaxID=2956931 RepID=UPI00333707E8